MTQDPARERNNTMDRETDIFDQDVQEGSSSGDLDVDLANAGHVLQKLAEEIDVDLNTLPDADVATLVRDLLPDRVDAQTTQETRKEASMSTETETQPETTIDLPAEPTYADVAVELAKIAAAEGIDLATVPREDYTQAFSDLAEKMADPEYGRAKQAEDEKLAAAYVQGQRMADGFLDRLKEAEDEDEKKDKERKEEEGKKEAGAAAFFRGAKEKAKAHAGKLVGKADKHVQRAGERLLNVVGAGGEKASPSLKRRTAGGAAAAAAGTAAAGGAGAHHMRKKSSLDDAALVVAHELAREMGYDPTTGEKLAESAVEAEPEITQDEVAVRAIEMLKEAGYPVE
jgi:hypothetical protein